MCVCFYIYRYMKREKERDTYIHALKITSFLKAHGFNALELTPSVYSEERFALGKRLDVYYHPSVMC